MNKRIALPFLLASILMTGCYRQAYFLSPSNASTNFYHAAPLRSDSIKSASYLGGTLLAGGANDFLKDEVYSFQGFFHRMHTFNSIQAYYGANFSLGSYRVQDDYYRNIGMPANYKPGRNFFGGVGVSGGMHVVIPMGTRHEWRVIGIQTTLQNEYGDYLAFRKGIPDSSVNAVSKSNIFASAGLTTEFAFKIRRGGSFGYKLAIGSALQKTNRYYTDSYNPHSSIIPTYVSNTFQFTRKQLTGFGQINLGTYAANFQLGITCRLGNGLKSP